MTVDAAERQSWEKRHHGATPGAPEPFAIEMMPLLPQGARVLDVAAGLGRNAIALARAGHRVIAVDFAETAMGILGDVARRENLAISPVVANMDDFQLCEGMLDAILIVNFLDRALFPRMKNWLKIGGIVLSETFLIDQAEIGHPQDPRFLLRHYELRELLGGLELLRYREGLATFGDSARAWRAGAVARRIR